MITKLEAIKLYHSIKIQLGKQPNSQEYFMESGLNMQILIKIYGSSSFSKLQLECSDEPSKWGKDRTSIDEIMMQYGDLAMELNSLPKQADWIHKKCRPMPANISKPPHNIPWPHMPIHFKAWAMPSEKYVPVLSWIPDTEHTQIKNNINTKLEKLLTDIREWSPDRRRNVEETYKVELRNQLRTLKYELTEERGDSNVDLVVNNTFAIETKKEPALADYDRMFGQIARHLEQYSTVIAVIFDVPRQDQFVTFQTLVDKHFNPVETKVLVIKKYHPLSLAAPSA